MDVLAPYLKVELRPTGDSLRRRGEREFWLETNTKIFEKQSVSGGLGRRKGDAHPASEVDVERLRPHRHLVLERVVDLRLPFGYSLHELEVLPCFDSPLKDKHSVSKRGPPSRGGARSEAAEKAQRKPAEGTFSPGLTLQNMFLLWKLLPPTICPST